ncbi:MAG: SDR family NAD(P)-dependent oxidoreductase, partial [Desulfamplus sp.]|nr:SDR family NAD(P)-dependent oxidoreductase [Desulfamplus sp.]
ESPELSSPELSSPELSSPELSSPVLSWRNCIVVSDVVSDMVSNTGDTEAHLADMLKANGANCTVVKHINDYKTENFINHQDTKYTSKNIDYKHIDAIIITSGLSTTNTDILDTDILDTANFDLIQKSGCRTLLETVQTLEKLQLSEPPALWIITRGAAPVSGYSNAGFTNSPLWAMGQVMAKEYPELGCTMIDLDPEENDPANAAQVLFRLLRHDLTEEPLAIRGGICHAARFQRIVPSSVSQDLFISTATNISTSSNLMSDRAAHFDGAIQIRKDASYLITGGLGDLGLLTARWLVEKKGARSITLVGRSEPSASALKQISDIESLDSDVRVNVVKADVSNYKQMADAVAEAQKDGMPLAGVIHSAGKLDDGVIASLTWKRVLEVLAPKVSGAWNLHQACTGLSLDFFILYSSIASQLAVPGQSSHAAGNAFLDALAAYRRNLGLPAMTINWGAWSDIGQAVRLHGSNTKINTMLNARGISTIKPEQGLEILSHLFDHPVVQVTVSPMDWPRLIEKIGNRPLFQYLHEEIKTTASRKIDALSSINALSSKEDILKEEMSKKGMSKKEGAKQSPTSISASREGLFKELADMPIGEQHAKVMEIIKTHTAKILRFESVKWVEEDTGFFDQGMDSLTAIELRNSLQADFAVVMPTTLLFKYPTVRALAEHLLNNLLKSMQSLEKKHPNTESEATSSHEKTTLSKQSATAGDKVSVNEISDMSKNEISDMSEEELAALIDGELNDLITGGS